jgi:hypothetical protein
MDIILVNTMSTGLYDSIKYFLFNKKDKNIIIDPFSCIIKLGLLSYQTEGTKISIIDNQICFNGPNVGQGIIRYLYGDGREDLHNLFKPIQKSVEWYKERDFTDIGFLFERAKVGMLVLKKSYGKFETIQHTIDYYISILDGTISSNHFLNNQFEIMKADYETQEKEKLQRGNKRNQTNVQNNQNTSETSSNSGDTSSNSKKKKPKANDLEIFLKRLWSKEEVHIVINLFKEFNNKEGEEDQKFIFDSIINYCMMKENKLHNYIKEKSSILE